MPRERSGPLGDPDRNGLEMKAATGRGIESACYLASFPVRGKKFGKSFLPLILDFQSSHGKTEFSQGLLLDLTNALTGD